MSASEAPGLVGRDWSVSATTTGAALLLDLLGRYSIRTTVADQYKLVKMPV